jgi:tetratricopeptide (TPR) repeat protein
LKGEVYLFIVRQYMASPGFPRFVLFIVPMAVVFLLAACIALQNVGGDNHCRPDPSAPAAYSDDAKTAEDFLKRGDAAFDRGSCKEAIAVYTQALALNPDYAEAYNNRTYTYTCGCAIMGRRCRIWIRHCVFDRTIYTHS